MAGNSENLSKSRSKPRKWVLRSPGRKPSDSTSIHKGNLRTDGEPLTPPRPTRSQQAQQTLQAPPTQDAQYSPSNESKRAIPEAPLTRSEHLGGGTGATASAQGSRAVGTSSRSRSPLSRLRNKMPKSSTGIMKRFRRRSPHGVNTTTEGCSQRGTDGLCTGDTRHNVELAVQNDGGTPTQEDDAMTVTMEEEEEEQQQKEEEEEEEEEKKARGVAALVAQTGTAAPTEATSQPSSQCTPHHESHRARHHSEPSCEASPGHHNPERGVEEISAVKAGKVPPRITFIGVFLNGVSVALASFAPFGGVDARIALVKALLLEPGAKVSPGYCYTARGSELAVHIIVDQKHRVYACITTEDVPFSVGLSLLEEVQIEYISITSTLAFSTKENSHNVQCHAILARSWTKYEGIERALSHERETRRLLGEDRLDLESPLSGGNTAYAGAEVTPLQFNAGHQGALLAATREAFSLENEQHEVVVVDIADPAAAGSAGLEKRGHRKIKAAVLATGVAAAIAGLYAARRVIFAF